MLALTTLEPEDYVHEVLPHSQSLWAGRRTFDEYVDEFRAAAGSGWGRRRFRTLGLHVDGELVASCKRYERVLRCGEREYLAAGIGAVFTPVPLRGRGYATALLGAFLDAERAAGTDLAYLFSDIGTEFYARLGFAALPSRTITLRADALLTERVAIATLNAADLSTMRQLFTALEARRPFAFKRTPLDWEWQTLRAASREHDGAPLLLGVRRGRSLAAYVSGRRVPAADAFVLDELAYGSDEDACHVAALLRAAAGDLRKIQGWLPPAPVRRALPRGAVRARNDAIAMLLPLSRGFRAAWRGAAGGDATADPCWSTDHI
jgi:predicted N-acetyltransferase YhbS